MSYVSNWTECPLCEIFLPLEILYSPAGFFLGCSCECKRTETQESGFFQDKQEAENMLRSWMLSEGIEIERNA